MRSWFWKVEEEGGGPDYMFIASFEPGDAERLAALLRAFPLSGFRLNDIVFAEPEPEGIEDVSLVDEYTYQKLVAQRDSGQRENIYISTSVWVKEHKFFVHCGYGGVGSAGTLIEMLAQSSEVTLAKWEVWSWGYGSGSDRVFAEGTTGQELLKYLQPAPSPTTQSGPEPESG